MYACLLRRGGGVCSIWVSVLHVCLGGGGGGYAQYGLVYACLFGGYHTVSEGGGGMLNMG